MQTTVYNKSRVAEVIYTKEYKFSWNKLLSQHCTTLSTNEHLQNLFLIHLLKWSDNTSETEKDSEAGL
jgi:hypothetical protein